MRRLASEVRLDPSSDLNSFTETTSDRTSESKLLCFIQFRNLATLLGSSIMVLIPALLISAVLTPRPYSLLEMVDLVLVEGAGVDLEREASLEEEEDGLTGVLGFLVCLGDPERGMTEAGTGVTTGGAPVFAEMEETLATFFSFLDLGGGTDSSSEDEEMFWEEDLGGEAAEVGGELESTCCVERFLKARRSLEGCPTGPTLIRLTLFGKRKSSEDSMPEPSLSASSEL